MDFSALENEAVARIQSASLAPEVRVAAYPDASNLNQPTGSGLILVRFVGLDLSRPRSPDRSYTKQEGSISLEARFFVKNLRTHTGAYDLISAAQKQLSGWLPRLAAPLSAQHPGVYLTSVDLIGRNEQVWDWGALFKVDVLLEHIN